MKLCTESEFVNRLVSLVAMGLIYLSASARADQTILDNVTVETGDTPRVRFAQTVELSQPLYTWDVAANESAFFVRDVTGGNVLPMRIQAGSPANSLFISANGSVGFGTASPTAAVHFAKSSQAATAEVLARFAVADDATSSLIISNATATDGTFIPKIVGRAASANAALINEAIITLDTGTGPAIAYNCAVNGGTSLATRPLVVYRNNQVAKVTIAANGDISATSFNPSSSRKIKHDIVDLDSGKASLALQKLTPVEFVYNEDLSGEKRVGFIAEDVPELVANADRQSVPIMDVVALVTRVVKDQQKTIDDQKKMIDTLATRLNALENPEPKKSFASP